MAQDLNKVLERARRSLEKNKLREAVAEYQAVLQTAPANQEALQALADIYIRLNEPVRAAHFFGLQFDRLVDAGDATKAGAIYTRFLKAVPQPPDRMQRFAALLQKLNRPGEAIEYFSQAAERFVEQNQHGEAAACLERVTLLDPENATRHVALAVLAAQAGNTDLGARSYLRAGQLTAAAGDLDRALEYFGQAHQLMPQDRSSALLFAEARLRKNDAAGAVALLEPFPLIETDTTFLAIFGEALLRTHQLDRAREMLMAYYRQKQDSFLKLFELASAYLEAGRDDEAVAVLQQTREWMRGLRHETEFAAQADRVAESFPQSVRLTEFVAQMYDELNREAKYFDVLVHLFDLYFAAARIPEACEVLDRLVDIDPYDYRNHERIARLEGKVDPEHLRSIQARAAKAATIGTRADAFGVAAPPGVGEGTNHPLGEEARARQALEDLIVQAEIFLQYSLESKALERLERIAESFPGEEERNERLRALCEKANWWPKGSPPKPTSAARVAPSAEPAISRGPGFSVETHRDLAAIAEITRLLYRHATPLEVLTTAVNEIGRHLGVGRCLVTVGGPGDPQLTAEFFAPILEPAGGARSAAVLGLLAAAPPDSLGGIELRVATTPVLRELGLTTALGVRLTDKETQAPAGTLMVGDCGARRWKPNESFFLQAVGDQIVLTVNHTRLRSLVRTLAVADEKTGLLGRGAYLNCLLAETNRAKSQSTPLSLIILQVDRGTELLRQYGDAALGRYLEDLARAIGTTIRQTDLAVKYTAWSLAFILPDTVLESARALAEKLRRAASAVSPPWPDGPITLSAVVAEVARHPGDEPEDRVTEWINRAEFGLEELRQTGGDAVLGLPVPQK